jgi:3-oxoacyl-[acyl-carrier protein] reductase
MSFAKSPILDLSRSVKGRKALITGGASGMGRATAYLFGREGARVAVTDVDAAGAEEVAAGIREEGNEALAWPLDVGDREAIHALVPEIADALGGLDIIVNNAGISKRVTFDDPDYERDWDRNLAITLTGQQTVIRAAVPFLSNSDAPRIINIASTEALGASAGFSAYSAAKAGVIGLTRSFSVELGRRGITVNCLCPGPILTGMSDHLTDEDRATFARRRTSLRRYGDPMEVAHITLSLALPAASYITGAIIPVDGGLSTRHA